MGYTHFYKGLVLDADFASHIERIVDRAEMHWIEVRSSDGESAPIVNAKHVSLNGSSDAGQSCEPFVLSSLGPAGSGDARWFTKTMRKPYDAVVGACLVDAVAFRREGWEGIGSDGDLSDWATAQGAPLSAIDLFEEAIDEVSPEAWADLGRLLGGNGSDAGSRPVVNGSWVPAWRVPVVSTERVEVVLSSDVLGALVDRGLLSPDEELGSARARELATLLASDPSLRPLIGDAVTRRSFVAVDPVRS